MKEIVSKITAALKNGNRFLVASHANPDGDAIGSTLAMALALESMGKEVVAYNKDGVPYQFDSLPGADNIVGNLAGEASFDVAIVLDCSELERVGDGFSEEADVDFWINIDHHLTNKSFADIGLIDKDACSTGYLVYKVLKSLELEISRDIAVNIYTTIMADTGSFRYSNATDEAFCVAGEMVALGVSPWDIANKVYENQPLGSIKLLGKVLDTLEVDTGGQIASVVVTEEMLKDAGVGHDATDGFVNYPRSVNGVEVAMLMRQIGLDEYKISCRSKGKINVAAVAEKFGGGGHRNAAGFRMKGKMADVRASAVAAFKEVVV